MPTPMEKRGEGSGRGTTGGKKKNSTDLFATLLHPPRPASLEKMPAACAGLNELNAWLGGRGHQEVEQVQEGGREEKMPGEIEISGAQRSLPSLPLLPKVRADAGLRVEINCYFWNKVWGANDERRTGGQRAGGAKWILGVFGRRPPEPPPTATFPPRPL